MTKLDLFLELTYITTHLLESGITESNIYESHHMMDYSFDRFEELDGVTDFEKSEMDTILDGIAIKILETPKDLKDYFKAIENFQNENEIYLCDLPPKFQNQTMEQVQFMSELFIILNDLLEMGITACNAHVARMKIDDLFQAFQEEEPDVAPNHLNHFFPNLENDLNKITIFCDVEVEI